MRESWGSKLFNGFNCLFLSLYALLTVIPFIYVIAGSFSTPEELALRGFILFPTQFSLDAYAYILSTPTLLRSMAVSIYITLAGTFISMLLTVLMAYPLARNELIGRRPILLMVLFTMLFHAGIIPMYIMVKSLGMINTYWSLMLPYAISAFNLMILVNFFRRLPEGLEEAARIDGCSDVGILFKIVVPLSLPAIATFSLFYAVNQWNAFFAALIFLTDNLKWPVQVLLRQMIMMEQSSIGEGVYEAGELPAQTIKMAVIVFGTLPILLVYPFIQKHFTQGILLGSIKG